MFGQGLIFGGFSATPLSIDYFIVAGGQNAGGPGPTYMRQGGSGGSANYVTGYNLASGVYTVTIGGGSTATSFGDIETVQSATTTTSPAGTFSKGNPIGPPSTTFNHSGGGSGGSANGANATGPNTYNQFMTGAGPGGNGLASPVFGGTYQGGGGGYEYWNGIPPSPWTVSTGGTGGGGDSVWRFISPGNIARDMDADVNTGGGAGAMGTLYAQSWNGGSGIAKIRYLTADGTATGGTITTSGAYTIHTFTTTGDFTF